MDQHVLQDNTDLASQHSSDMEIDTDDHDDSSSSDSNQDPFVQLLRNQGAVFYMESESDQLSFGRPLPENGRALLT